MEAEELLVMTAWHEALESRSRWMNAVWPVTTLLWRLFLLTELQGVGYVMLTAGIATLYGPLHRLGDLRMSSATALFAVLPAWPFLSKLTMFSAN